MDWPWHRTRRVDPARGDRHWLVLTVATLWVLAQVPQFLHRGYTWARIWLQPLPGPDPPKNLQWVAPPGSEPTVND